MGLQTCVALRTPASLNSKPVRNAAGGCRCSEVDDFRQGDPVIESSEVGSGKNRDVLCPFLDPTRFLRWNPPVFEESAKLCVRHFLLVRDPEDLLHVPVHTHLFDHPGGKPVRIEGYITWRRPADETAVVVPEYGFNEFHEKGFVEKTTSIYGSTFRVEADSDRVLVSKETARHEQEAQHLGSHVLVEPAS